jgi:hypothetical protein
LLRSASSRNENRISALNAASIVPRYTAAHARKKTISGIIDASPSCDRRRTIHGRRGAARRAIGAPDDESLAQLRPRAKPTFFSSHLAVVALVS